MLTSRRTSVHIGPLLSASHHPHPPRSWEVECNCDLLPCSRRLKCMMPHCLFVGKLQSCLRPSVRSHDSGSGAMRHRGAHATAAVYAYDFRAVRHSIPTRCVRSGKAVTPDRSACASCALTADVARSATAIANNLHRILSLTVLTCAQSLWLSAVVTALGRAAFPFRAKGTKHRGVSRSCT